MAIKNSAGQQWHVGRAHRQASIIGQAPIIGQASIIGQQSIIG
jgi:hypothetical protein